MSDDLLYPRDAPALPGLSFRRFRGEADFPRMVAVIEASKVPDGIERVDSVEQVANTYAHLNNCDPYRDMIMVEAGGELVGYGRGWWMQETGGPRLYCHFGFLAPAWRRCGIGRAMLHWLQDRLRQVAAGHDVDCPRFFQAEVSQAEAGAEALLRGDGYTPVRYGLLMVRPDLEEIPDAPLPAGLEVRPVLPEHYRAIWEAEGEAFRDHWGYVPPTEADYQFWLNDPIASTPELWQIAWDGDQVAGMVRGFINAAENEEYGRARGWAENISIRRPWRRRGLARALILRTLRLFRERGMQEAALGVDSENLSGALRLYEGCGFRPVRRDTLYRKPL